MKPIITITGVDENVGPRDMDRIATDEVEIGFLYSATNRGNRYANLRWLQHMAYAIPRAAIHICGGPARHHLLTGNLDVQNFQRIQINGVVAPEELSLAIEIFPDHKIITQHSERNARLLELDHFGHQVLIDGSGGRGISPEDWQFLQTDKPVGFAGGLGPDNLAAELQRIFPVSGPGWWIDMEGKLRDERDLFSVEKAKQVIEIFKRATQP